MEVGEQIKEDAGFSLAMGSDCEDDTRIIGALIGTLTCEPCTSEEEGESWTPEGTIAPTGTLLLAVSSRDEDPCTCSAEASEYEL